MAELEPGSSVSLYNAPEGAVPLACELFGPGSLALAPCTRVRPRSALPGSLWGVQIPLPSLSVPQQANQLIHTVVSMANNNLL
jgi:hypothetical protein